MLVSKSAATWQLSLYKKECLPVITRNKKHLSRNKFCYEHVRSRSIAVLATLKCYRRNNEYEIRIFFKLLVSKSAAMWRLH